MFIRCKDFHLKMKIPILCITLVLIAENSQALKPVQRELKPIPIKPVNKVLLCLDSDDQLIKLTWGSRNHFKLLRKLIDEHPEIEIESNTISSCQVKIEGADEKFLAVVASKPLELSSELPIYFFDTPFLNNEDIDEFPNGLFPLRNHWRSLKHAFSHYITVHGWKRVVIVSDDSYYSQAFEEELIKHFIEKDFVFEAKRCVNTKGGCSFNRALKYIKDNKGFIIIVNIDKAHAHNLASSARDYNMLSNRFVWLVREWPFEYVREPIMELTVSMTMSPFHAPYYQTDCEHDGPNLNSVSRGLALISDAVKKVALSDRYDYYYNAIYKHMNETDECRLSKAFIRKFNSGIFHSIKSIIIQDSGHIVDSYPKDYYGDCYDLAEFCLQRSASFENPCNDTYIVIICVVWIMFILMAVVLMFFFNRCLVWT